MTTEEETIMPVGDRRDVRGYVTQDKFIAGRPMAEIERNLGFHAGRLAKGALFIRIDRLPLAHEFELAAYSMTAEHHYTPPTNLDIAKLKTLAMRAWTLAGPDRLVKVIATIGHDSSMTNDDQYPPGQGVPQWKITTLVPGTVVCEATSGADVYRPRL